MFRYFGTTNPFSGMYAEKSHCIYAELHTKEQFLVRLKYCAARTGGG